MKLHYYRPDENTSNFGDELNKYIWEAYLPDFFDDNEDHVFFGIGTVVKEAKKFYSKSQKVFILGSGVRSEGIKVLNNVEILFVRGPLSAKALHVPEKFITDPAILTPKIFPSKKVSKKWAFSFMPHFSSINDKYMQVFKANGVHIIDPRDDVKQIIEAINASEILLTEAMHGAIVADAYRVPWIPIKSYESFNHFKWNDWSQSHHLNIKINKIPRFFNSDNKLKFLVKHLIFKYQLNNIKRLQPYLSDKQIHDNHIKSIEKAIDMFRTNYENKTNNDLNGV